MPSRRLTLPGPVSNREKKAVLKPILFILRQFFHFFYSYDKMTIIFNL